MYLLHPPSTSLTKLSCVSGSVLPVLFVIGRRWVDTLGVGLEANGSALCLAGPNLSRSRCVWGLVENSFLWPEPWVSSIPDERACLSWASALGRLWPKGVRIKHLGSVYPLGWRGVCPCTCAECRGEHCHHHPCPRADVPAHGRGRMLCREIKEESWNEKMTTSRGEKALNSSMKLSPFFQISAPLRTCINHMLKVLEGWMCSTCVCLCLYLVVDWPEKRISTLGAPDHET